MLVVVSPGMPARCQSVRCDAEQQDALADRE
jgi:hypothetical protein